MRRYETLFARVCSEHEHREFEPTLLKGALIMAGTSEMKADRVDSTRSMKQAFFQKLAHSSYAIQATRY